MEEKVVSTALSNPKAEVVDFQFEVSVLTSAPPKVLDEGVL